MHKIGVDDAEKLLRRLIDEAGQGKEVVINHPRGWCFFPACSPREAEAASHVWERGRRNLDER